MLDIGLQELLLILIVALLVFGPKRLPELGRALGRAMREFRRASDEFRSTLETNLQLNELDPVASTPEPVVAEPPPVTPVEAAPGPLPDSLRNSYAESPAVPAEPYVAQRGARLFHRRECGWIGRVAEADQLYFKRLAEASEQGLAACPVCEPWEPE